ncbi:hypothetical protein N181_12505 [Sinorhizobium fredii USDA 205]|uniref:DUF983 domain-containing protein n=2 Tax=Rhizobium fredii TaxID=380 RepID=A0A2A6LY80_RHIFR|nr:DUF983 domain-containing protein [Sinorhizobium fredii]ASY68457.1 ZINC-FINGER protein [Sinorhizobium fredii CCBAU 83666]AWM24525.1 ZINC-FINGER PROTEIN [Sinorhizobium fredii CCBAU 25509]KSV90376.1 hypothetical protein N181_12505 [Sinorhizobium fredii USDA 205]MCG5474496.1 DUF983 domain-containing protein [Sinorhizobium fredii]MQW97590.1 DUF983 domain-containing protein [Sinorhizobium fredii]
MKAMATDKLQLGGEQQEERPVGRAMKRGFLGKCPACGQGRLFRGFVKSVDACAACGERMDHHRADDFPPYIVVTIVGHVVLGGYMMTDLVLPLSTWQHLAVWAPVTLVSALALMQPVKGAVIGLQWALKMHGFGGHEDRPEDVLPPRDPSA